MSARNSAPEASSKSRLDVMMSQRGLVVSRSQAESWIRLGKVFVDGAKALKPGQFVPNSAQIQLHTNEQYVSRAGLKLASVVNNFGVQFEGTTVLDVGSSTGGFTDYALQHGAKLVIAVDVGTDQLHPSLRNDQRIELHEKTDIRNFTTSHCIDIIVIDVSFISLREILLSLLKFCQPHTKILAMVKPQFEAGKDQTHRGVIKNDAERRKILQNFEQWVKGDFHVLGKRDSQVAGAKGNRERFYMLTRLAK